MRDTEIPNIPDAHNTEQLFPVFSCVFTKNGRTPFSPHERYTHLGFKFVFQESNFDTVGTSGFYFLFTEDTHSVVDTTST